MTSSLPLAAAQDYPLLNLFWTMLWLFLWILWIFLLVRILLDVFRSDDLNGLSKALWTIFIIVLPFLGVLVYLIARGSSMHLRENRQVQANQEAADTYIRSVAGTSASTADELSKLARLRDDGVLTATEFDAQKARLLG